MEYGGQVGFLPGLLMAIEKNSDANERYTADNEKNRKDHPLPSEVVIEQYIVECADSSLLVGGTIAISVDCVADGCIIIRATFDMALLKFLTKMPFALVEAIS